MEAVDAKNSVVFNREDDGSVPLIDWLDALPPSARVKCQLRIRRLSALGHALRRPEADLLRDGVYELRVALQGINYRMLYVYYGNVAAVVSHGLVKERQVPDKDIDDAIRRKRKFAANPTRHTYEEP